MTADEVLAYHLVELYLQRYRACSSEIAVLVRLSARFEGRSEYEARDGDELVRYGYLELLALRAMTELTKKPPLQMDLSDVESTSIRMIEGLVTERARALLPRIPSAEELDERKLHLLRKLELIEEGRQTDTRNKDAG